MLLLDQLLSEAIDPSLSCYLPFWLSCKSDQCLSFWLKRKSKLSISSWLKRKLNQCLFFWVKCRDGQGLPLLLMCKSDLFLAFWLKYKSDQWFESSVIWTNVYHCDSTVNWTYAKWFYSLENQTKYLQFSLKCKADQCLSLFQCRSNICLSSWLKCK